MPTLFGIDSSRVDLEYVAETIRSGSKLQVASNSNLVAALADLRHNRRPVENFQLALRGAV